MKRRVNRDTLERYYTTEYIDKDEFKDEMRKSSKQGRLTERAGELVITLVENIVLSSHFKLSGKPYEVTEAVIDNAIMFILDKGFSRYDPDNEKANPFSYFSSIVFSQSKDFLRLRYGKLKRLDLYGKKLKYYRNGAWRVMKEVNLSSLQDDSNYNNDL